ncbi:hypothetical protein PROFUN_14215 [Planoprotostelium fungivorum]|uniref:Uncharacterized protein n=1 Tax=Planoprotostelium fungivorum TaxID=1890364 RepID=A0A2P6N0N1_9EUKA|nr:hypothetical protein PROFUN_14215 [Planoprotostelium fungivorum]
MTPEYAQPTPPPHHANFYRGPPGPPLDQLPYSQPPPIYRMPPPNIPPPPNMTPEELNLTEKLIEFVMKHGPASEETVMKDPNTPFSFLFSHPDKFNYYRFRLSTRQPQLVPPHVPPAQMFVPPHVNPGYPAPPPPMMVPPSHLVATPYHPPDELEKILFEMNATSAFIKSAKNWIMENMSQHDSICKRICQKIEDPLYPPPSKLAAIFLLNDVLYFCASLLPLLPRALSIVYHSEPREENVKQVNKIINLWKTRKIYDEKVSGGGTPQGRPPAPPSTTPDPMILSEPPAPPSAPPSLPPPSEGQAVTTDVSFSQVFEYLKTHPGQGYQKVDARELPRPAPLRVTTSGEKELDLQLLKKKVEFALRIGSSASTQVSFKVSITGLTLPLQESKSTEDTPKDITTRSTSVPIFEKSWKCQGKPSRPNSGTRLDGSAAFSSGERLGLGAGSSEDPFSSFRLTKSSKYHTRIEQTVNSCFICNKSGHTSKECPTKR